MSTDSDGPPFGRYRLVALQSRGRDAITDPIERRVPVHLAATEPAANWVAAQQSTFQTASSSPVRPAPPPPPAPPARTTARGRRTIALFAGAVVVVVAAACGNHTVTKPQSSQSSATPSPPTSSGQPSAQAVRVTSSKLITQPGTTNPKAVMSFYEDFLCPACGNFEQTFGPTVSNLIDSGAIAADYSMVAILDSKRTQDYSSRAGAAALCVADESIDAFRRFHDTLFSKGIQPSETGTSFPDNARLVELARVSGAAGTVPDCVNSGKYLSKVRGAASAAGIHATPTIKINGEEYDWSTPGDLVTKIKQIVGDVPGLATF